MKAKLLKQARKKILLCYKPAEGRYCVIVKNNALAYIKFAVLFATGFRHVAEQARQKHIVKYARSKKKGRVIWL